MKKTVLLFVLILAPFMALAQNNDTYKFDTIKNESRAPERQTRYSRKLAAETVTQEKTVSEKASLRTDSSAPRGAAAPKVNPWIFGGSFGFSFADNGWGINISPQIGYRFNRYLVLGGGASYSYYDYKHWDYTLNYFGLTAYLNIYPVRNIFISLQPEVYRRWGHVYGERNSGEVFMTMPVGVGVTIPTWQGGINMSIYYDVIQNRYSPYGDRLGYSVGYVFYW